MLHRLPLSLGRALTVLGGVAVIGGLMQEVSSGTPAAPADSPSIKDSEPLEKPPSVKAAALVREPILPGLVVLRGPVNGAILERGGRALAVYGDPREASPRGGTAVDTVLFTHARRDVVWAGRALVERGAKAVVPAAEASGLADARRFWSDFTTRRFHDYAQQTTKIIAEPMPVARGVRGGETFTWEGLSIRVLDTPGYTRGAVSYLLALEGKRVAFTGDLIHGDGRIFDLYSLQDAIPEAKIGGYHGHAARLGDVVSSLGRLAAERPDIVVPVRGPVIRDPQAAVERLVRRIRAYYANYLSIDALRWYFHDDHILAKARRVLGPDARVDWMPLAETVEPKLPSWIVAIGNSRLILAADGSGFLVDCGGQYVIDELKKLQTEGRLTSLQHVFITHYHDDHTDQVSKLVDAFGSTVHASHENREILEDPGAHRLPCLTSNPIHVSGRASIGRPWRWKEFEVTLFYFPGQTLHHDALRVKKDRGEAILFVGDSFTPSGIDDYCLQNRNLLHSGTGFFFCLDFLKGSAPECLLINQHVEPVFRFSSAQLDRMRDTLEKRLGILRDLLPWDDPNWGLDEGWARFHPYATEVRRGTSARIELRILNHSPAEQVFEARLRLPRGWSLLRAAPDPLRLPSLEEGAIEFSLAAGGDSPDGIQIVTADLRWGDWDLREWTEAIVTVLP